MAEPTLSAPCPWNSRPIACWLAGSAVACPAGVVSKAVPLTVCGERSAAEALALRLRKAGYRVVQIRIVSEQTSAK